ncbi:MAG: sulfate ABC transporter permease subunit CysW [Burkholderiales bacterium]|nr:sulfate ABC transporter permease subunit CysW [Burkholderiales bacterium]
MMQKTSFANESLWVKRAGILITLGFLAVFIVLPLYTIFSEAFRSGVAVYKKAVTSPEVLSSIRLTLTVALVCVPINTIFGTLLAWSIAKYSFRGKKALTTLIELPFAVSPVIAGLMFVLLFGAHGGLGRWLQSMDIKIVFALPGIILATTFVTFPFIARTLIPLMESLGNDDEEAALTLGASGLQTFFKITLSNIKWGLLYGIILTNARAIGEYGAVAVVSGLIRGETTTLPLTIGFLFDEYAFSAAFAAASLLTLLAFVTLILKSAMERRLKASD